MFILTQNAHLNWDDAVTLLLYIVTVGFGSATRVVNKGNVMKYLSSLFP